MVTDRNGKEIKQGDEFIIRGKVNSIAMDLEDDGRGVLFVQWQKEGIPLINYIESKNVEVVEKVEAVEKEEG